MACRGTQRIEGGNDKCKDYVLHTRELKLSTDRLYQPGGVKINGKLIASINETFTAALTDEEICKYLKAIDNIRSNNAYNWETKANSDSKNSLKKAERFLCKNLKPATCEDKLTEGNPSFDQELFDKKVACDADDTKRWRNCKCKIIQPNNDEVVNEPAEVYGCLDSTASNYYCLTNDCVDNKPPSHVKGVGCDFQKKYNIVNNYVFCNKPEGCLTDTKNKVTSTLNTATVEDNGTLQGQEGGALAYINEVYDAQKVIIKKANDIKNFLYLKKDGEPQGFYMTSTWNDTLVNEFAAALTIEIFRTKGLDQTTFPFQRVTVFSPDSRLLGHFSIVPNTELNGGKESINRVVGKESSRLLNYRLKFHVGTQIMSPNLIDMYRKALDSGSGTFDSTYSLDGEGRIIKDPITEGLMSVLKEKPIGLAKLLK